MVQLYVGFSHSKIDRPLKLLRGFKKIPLNQGEKKTVSFEIKIEDLAYYDTDTKSWKVEVLEYEVYAGSSSRKDDLLKDKFTVV